MRTQRFELHDDLRRVLLDDLLPELLHDLNNDAAVLDGLAILLGAEALQPAKIRERAAALQRSAESCARIAWLGSALSAALGSPLAVEERSEGVRWLLELVASSLERRGGELAFAPASFGSPAGDPAALCGVAALIRASAGDGPARVVIEDAGNGWRARIEGGSPRFECATGAEPVSRALGIPVRVTRGMQRAVCVGCEPTDAA